MAVKNHVCVRKGSLCRPYIKSADSQPEDQQQTVNEKTSETLTPLLSDRLSILSEFIITVITDMFPDTIDKDFGAGKKSSSFMSYSIKISLYI